MKLAIIDLDGVIADNTARFAKAEEAKAAYLAQDGMAMELGDHGGVITQYGTVQESDLKRANDLYWRTAFTPDLVQLDTLMDGVPKAINMLWMHDYHISFLTSRPESMREATVQWLEEHGFIFAATDLSKYLNDDPMGIDHLIMKPGSAQFVKTVTWKLLTVEMLVRLFGVDDLLFVDDEPAIYESVAALALPCNCKVNASLQAILAML